MFLVAATRRDDLEDVRREPELWRRVRRFNLPVQLAVAAGEAAAAAAASPAQLALVSLAPCFGLSPELREAIRSLEAADGGAMAPAPRVNPTVTLHAVDNLALSALAIALGNRAYCLGLGGAAGQAWAALEAAGERLADGLEDEVLVVAGDQDAAGRGALAVALLFSRGARPWPPRGRPVHLAAIERAPAAASGEPPAPHAAAGLAALLDALAEGRPDGPFGYVVPGRDGDGRERLTLRWEIG
jgi:hypothetical protein